MRRMALPALLAACGPAAEEARPVLAALAPSVVADGTDGLDRPRDLAFHPDHPDELWIVNQGDESVTIVWDLDEAERRSKHAWEPTGEHFLARPAGIAFGADGNFATIHDLYESTQGGYSGPDFMGPTLWTGDRATFDGGDRSHLDMLHNSPEGKGIAWEGPGNRYWVFDGFHRSITMYDFHDDHGLGGTDHQDGEVARYVEGEVSPHGNLPAHLEVDESGLLYVVDPGNDRIAVLDPDDGRRGRTVQPNFDGTDQYAVEDARLDTWIDTAEHGLGTPVGIAIADGVVYVSSVDPAAIHAFDLAGSLLDARTIEGEANGLAVGADGSLYYTDPRADEVVRLRP